MPVRRDPDQRYLASDSEIEVQYDGPEEHPMFIGPPKEPEPKLPEPDPDPAEDELKYPVRDPTPGPDVTPLGPEILPPALAGTDA